MRPDRFEPVRAAPETLLGRLQRGTGRGALQAAATPSAAVRDHVLECIRHDPREDRQVESRGDYYAKLLLRAGADGTAIEALLAEVTHRDLAISVLGELFLRGDHAAEQALRNDLEAGPEWETAASALLDERVDRPLPGVDRLLCARFPDDDDLSEAIGYRVGEREPWLSWRGSNPRIAAVIQRADRERPVRRPEAPNSYDDWSLECLMEKADQVRIVRPLKVMREKVVPEDRERLVAALDLTQPWRCRLALFGLAALADPETFPTLRSFAEANPDLRPLMLRPALYRAVVAVSGSASLGTARRWFDHSEFWLRRLGCGILEQHATRDDLVRLIDAVPTALADGDCYRQCSIVEALARVGDAAAVPAVERVYHEATYSWARADAFETLTKIAPARASEQLAYESLWDCECRTRSLACRIARADHSESYRRLSEMVADPFEDEGIRKQATARLD